MAQRKYESGWVRRIAEATDHDTAMRFVFAFSGMRIRIPLTISGSTQLQDVVGKEAAQKIIERYADVVVNVATERKNLLLWLKDQGFRTEEIAHLMRMGRRTAQQRLNNTVPKLVPSVFEEAKQ